MEQTFSSFSYVPFLLEIVSLISLIAVCYIAIEASKSLLSKYVREKKATHH